MRVNFHFGDVAAVGEGCAIGALGAAVERMPVRAARRRKFLRQFEQADLPVARMKITVAVGNSRRAPGIEGARRMRHADVDDFLRQKLQCAAGAVEGARTARAVAHQRGVRVALMQADACGVSGRQAELVGDDTGEGGLVPLAVGLRYGKEV